ncbi:MAG: ATP-binding protein, partial [Myxococcales bacterium]|nr:ATP-binding protein [Myxococcales bacterium]
LDEVGYLSYDNRHADLLFEVVSRRYQEQNAIVLTTNRPFGEWSEVFPNASCVVTLVDRLCHRAEIVAIEGDSYRVKEAKERAAKRRASRHSGKKKTARSRPTKSKN